MVSLGETITIRASKFQTRYQTGDGRFAICAFTAKPAEKTNCLTGCGSFPFPVIHTDYFRTPTRSQSDDGPRRYRHSAGAQQERKREKKGT